MKNTACRVGFAALIISVALVTTTRLAAAGSPPDSSVVGRLQTSVTDIQDKLGDSTSGLSAINANLTSLRESVAGAVSGVVSIETGRGNHVIAAGETGGGSIFEKEDSGIRHVSLTYRVEGLRSGYYYNDAFAVATLFPSSEGGLVTSYLVSLTGDQDGNFDGSIQFDASHWRILAWQFNEDSPIRVYWTYTETFPK